MAGFPPLTDFDWCLPWLQLLRCESSHQSASSGVRLGAGIRWVRKTDIIDFDGIDSLQWVHRESFANLDFAPCYTDAHLRLAAARASFACNAAPRLGP